MAKTFLYRLFGAGRIPDQLEDRIHKEHLVLVEEGIPVILYFENYKAPGKYFRKKIMRTSGYLCLTEQGLYGPEYGRIKLSIDWTNPVIHSFIFRSDEKALYISFDASLLDKKAEGVVEYRFRCTSPSKVEEQIKDLIG